MKRALMVAAREFHVTVRRKSYMLTVFGMPVLFGALIFISGYFTAKSAVTSMAAAVAIVDSSGVLDLAVLERMQDSGQEGGGLFARTIDEQMAKRLGELAPAVRRLATAEFTRFRRTALFILADADSAREATRRGDLDGALIIAADYMESGRVWGFGKAESFMNDDEESPAERVLRLALVTTLMDREGVDPAIRARLMNPMDLKEYELREAGASAGEFEEKGAASAIRSFALPYAFSLLLMMSIFMSAGFLLQGVAEEKENRVIELLLSALTPDELMLGKVLGLGGAGLLQMLIWLGLGIAVLGFASVQWMPDFEIPLLLFGQCLVYFLLGYLMIACLMAGAGSLGNTQKESQQLATWFTLPVAAPLIMMMAIISEPNGFIARLFSYIPLTTPVTMMLRLPSERVPWWEFPATVGILLLATWFALWFGARLFRLGSLMYGKRPTLPEIIRWMRQA